jgi:uncharacterized protein YkwD
MKLEIILPIIIILVLGSLFYFIRKKKKDNEVDNPWSVDGVDLITYTPKEGLNSIFETQLLFRINQHRESLNMKPLISEIYCNKLATRHTQYMISKGEPNHNNMEARRYELTRRGAKLYSENVGWAYNSADSFFEAYMDSYPHRNAFETKAYTHIGTSVITGDDGNNYNSLLFTKF